MCNEYFVERGLFCVDRSSIVSNETNGHYCHGSASFEDRSPLDSNHELMYFGGDADGNPAYDDHNEWSDVPDE
jgi:hypothetical protein